MRDQRMARQPIEKAAPRRQRPVFVDGEAGGIDVGAGIALVEIVPDGVVAGMLAPPVGIGREREHAAKRPTRLFALRRAKERAVAAIVLDDEDAHQKRAGRYGERERQPIGNLKRPVHQRAGAGEKDRCEETTAKGCEARRALSNWFHRGSEIADGIGSCGQNNSSYQIGTKPYHARRRRLCRKKSRRRNSSPPAFPACVPAYAARRFTALEPRASGWMSNSHSLAFAERAHARPARPRWRARTRPCRRLPAR